MEALELATGDPIIRNATILLFIGAIGKSAQLPLFTWLGTTRFDHERKWC
jgi:NADH:ubiquinone oxidoreductase subunit 5 (subunit L)/multisubunit Na+/H+ antiporter MnhA subunit